MANDKNFKVKNGLDVGLEATIGSTLNVTGESTLASVTVNDLTSGRLVVTGANGSIEDTESLLWNGNTLTITGTLDLANAHLFGDTADFTSVTINGLTEVGGLIFKNPTDELQTDVNLIWDGSTLDVNGTVDASSSLIIGQTTITSNATTARSVVLQDGGGTLAYLTDITGGGQTGFFEDVNINNSIIFEGATNDTNETIVVAEDPTADRTITLPNASGTVALLASPTITLTGAVTGTGTMIDYGNVSIATTATSDPTLTINGDASGTATFTNLGDATLTLTIADDSHNHTVANIDNFTENVQDIVGGMISSNTETGISVTYQDADGTLDFALTADPTLTLSGDASGTATFTNLGDATLSVTVDGGNADTLDNLNSTQFLRSDSSDAMNGTLTINHSNIDGIIMQSEGDGPRIQMKYENGPNHASIFAISATGSLALNNGINSLFIGSSLIYNEGGDPVNNYTVWHSGNDGTGSGLDADTLDGVQGSGYLRSNTSDTFTGTLTMSGNILPNSTNTRILGSSSLRWNTVYSTVFDGTATRARYADLAEIYKTDREYEPGTVVEFGGEFEVTETTKYATKRIAGVISTDPAFLMNKDSEGQAIALKGRVPCKVVGPVRKGDMLVASDVPGVAVASTEWIGGAMIGKSIEDNNEQEIKIVEVAVGVL